MLERAQPNTTTLLTLTLTSLSPLTEGPTERPTSILMHTNTSHNLPGLVLLRRLGPFRFSKELATIQISRILYKDRNSCGLSGGRVTNLWVQGAPSCVSSRYNRALTKHVSDYSRVSANSFFIILQRFDVQRSTFNIQRSTFTRSSFNSPGIQNSLVSATSLVLGPPNSNLTQPPSPGIW